MLDKIATGEAFIRKGSTVAKVTDQYGDERIIYKQKGMKDLRIKKLGSTPIESYNRIISTLLAARIKELRLEKKLTLVQLATRAGLRPASKQRMYEIEGNTRREAVRMGTLYSIAHALDVDPHDLLPTKEAVFEIYQSENQANQ